MGVSLSLLLAVLQVEQVLPAPAGSSSCFARPFSPIQQEGNGQLMLPKQQKSLLAAELQQKIDLAAVATELLVVSCVVGALKVREVTKPVDDAYNFFKLLSFQGGQRVTPLP